MNYRMYDLYSLCRLCMGTEYLRSLFEMKDTSFDMKVSSCLEIKIHPENGPTMICKACIKKVKKFYNFKQNCLKVSQKLRSIAYNKAPDTHIENNLPNNIEDHNTNEFSEKFCNNSEEIFYHYETSREMNFNCLENEHFIDESSNTKHIDEQSYRNKGKETKSSTTQCEHCGFIFNTKDFKKHLSSHGRLKLFQCKFCPKQFTRSETNVIHMRSHMGIKPFICEICGQSSTKRQDLIRHMKIHSDEKKYRCLTCGRRFKRSSDLCSHKRTHTGARPYKCRLCNKDYTSHGGLRKHRKTHCKKELEHCIDANNKELECCIDTNNKGLENCKDTNNKELENCIDKYK